MPVTNRHIIRPGDKFARVYKGQMFTCEAKIIGNGIGFETWDGAQFKTLSTAGKHVVKMPGYEINGYVFWNRAEEMPVKRGPKVGSHHTTPKVEVVQAVTGRKGRKAVEAVQAVGAEPPAMPSKRRKVLPIAAAQPIVDAAKPAPPKMLRNIKLTAGQDGCPDGQRRFFCSACMDSFFSPAAKPAQCPHGHPEKLPATLIEQGAHELLV